MQINGVIKFFYLLYTIYILIIVNITNITLFQIFFPIVFMWLNYLSFNYGFREKNIYHEKKVKFFLIFEKKKILIFITLLIVFFSLNVVKYYTGQTPISIIENIKNNISLYNGYQKYFNENNRGILSLKKIPYILMLFMVKLDFFSILLYFYKIKGNFKKNKVQKLCIIVTSLSYIYIGIARGTNFELFELCILIIYILLSKDKKNIQKKIFKILLLIIAMVMLYSMRLEQRGFKFSYYIAEDVYYITDNIVSNLFGDIDYFLLKIYGYFGFGFFYTGKFISDILFELDDGLLILLFPNWYYIRYNELLAKKMSDLVDIGVKWHPDIVILINKYGYVTLLIIIFLLGKILKNYHLQGQNTLIDELTKFFIVIFFISLPIGNFIVSSSSNRLIVIFIILYQLKKCILRRKNYV